jgi:hypothetical protein
LTKNIKNVIIYKGKIKMKYSFGVKEVWEQMYCIEADSFEEAKKIIRFGNKRNEFIVEEQVAYAACVDRAYDEEILYYERIENPIGFLRGKKI